MLLDHPSNTIYLSIRCRLEQYGAAFEHEGYDDLAFLLTLDRAGGSAAHADLSLGLSLSLRLTLSLS